MARPKGNYSLGDEPTRQPMRPAARGQIARNPSSDQKRQRRQIQRSAEAGHVECESCGYTGHPVLGDGTAANCAQCGSYAVHKTESTRPTPADYNSRVLDKGDYRVVSSKTATVLPSKAWQLNPGDQIRLPNGRTQKVTRVRQHETSMDHVYVDTDGGTALAKREDMFEVVPHNSAQLATPGWGVPGGNVENTPGGAPHETSVAPKNQCPTCGGRGTLQRSGNHYVCSQCGYREQFGGPAGHAFSDSPRQVRVSAYSTINSSTKSAVARRAEAMLNQKENQ